MSGPTMTIWNAVVAALSPLGCHEQRSRWGDKPALVLAGREIAHSETPGTVDLRITGSRWREVRADWSDDVRVAAPPGRRDWIELSLQSSDDVAEVASLLRAAVDANRPTPDMRRRATST